jgi:hypothetical protein
VEFNHEAVYERPRTELICSINTSMKRTLSQSQPQTRISLLLLLIVEHALLASLAVHPELVVSGVI